MLRNTKESDETFYETFAKYLRNILFVRTLPITSEVGLPGSGSPDSQFRTELRGSLRAEPCPVTFLRSAS